MFPESLERASRAAELGLQISHLEIAVRASHAIFPIRRCIPVNTGETRWLACSGLAQETHQRISPRAAYHQQLIGKDSVVPDRAQAAMHIKYCVHTH